MEYPKDREFDENKMPLKEGLVGAYVLSCVDVSEWNMSGNPEATILENDEVRFKTAEEIIPIEELIESCDLIRNTITELSIINGFDWPPSAGVRFNLTIENQTNFSNLYLLSTQDLLTYPRTVWSGVETFSLVDKQAVEDFYLAGVAHKELYLDQGLLAKQAFRTMSYAELTQWLADNQ